MSHPASAGVSHGPVASPGETHKGAEKMKARIYQDGNEVVRVIPADHDLHTGLIDAPQVERFWVPDLTSGAEAYVRRVTILRPGPLGAQVCVGLDKRGNSLMSTPAGLLDLVRRHHAIELREYKAKR